jgi:2-dehydro-3-deoxyphosphogluconate aldolase/(4S)-4-hydroxy-2-oxoglutarate aldolase
LAHQKVVAVGGSWVAPAADIKAGAWAKIEVRARHASALLQHRQAAPAKHDARMG